MDDGKQDDWMLTESQYDVSWDISDVRGRTLKNATLKQAQAELYQFPWPDPPLPQVGRRYNLRMPDGKNVPVKVIDDEGEGVLVGRVG